MNDSCAKEFCKRAGDRNGPVQNDPRTLWTSTRSLITVPVPRDFPPNRPAKYEGIPLLFLLKFAAAGAGERGSDCLRQGAKSGLYHPP